MKPPICHTCGHDSSCDVPCAAREWIGSQYKELRNAERREMIDAMRDMLGVRDAEYAPDVELIANDVVASIDELRFINEMSISIGYVRSYESKIVKGRAVLGDCRKVTTNQGAFLPFDFVITIYAYNTVNLSDNQFKVLLWHELRHIKLSERGLTVAPHDVEDFDSIISSCGLHWNALVDGDVPDICGGVINA